MKPTFVDADVLIAAAKGTEELSAPALAVLEDPGRSFVCSVYLKLEVLPIAAFFGRTEVVAFYEEFFDAVTHWVSSSPELSQRALNLACRHGLGAMDSSAHRDRRGCRRRTRDRGETYEAHAPRQLAAGDFDTNRRTGGE